MPKPAKLPWTVKQKSRAAIVVHLHTDTVLDGWEQWFLLRSDAHHDNPHCDRRMERDHLDEAVARNAGILDAGDLFCAMQGKYDPRRAKQDVRPEDNVADYIDSIIRHACEDYAPYADRWILMGQGNHETAIRKNVETDLSERLAERLNTLHGGNIHVGGYGGWVRFSLARRNERASIRMKYHHGHGGGGPVTKGTIQAQRRAIMYPDAHIVWSGHVHESYQVSHCRERISNADVVKQDEQVHVVTPGYKNEYADGTGGFHIERGRPPKPLGASWLRLFWCKRRESFAYEITPAR